MKSTADVRGGKPIADLLQSNSDVSDINHLVAFMTSMEIRQRWYSFILSRIPYETIWDNIIFLALLMVKLCVYSFG
jgi:hypothetical protein